MSEQESQSEKKPDPKKAEDLESGDLEGISSELENLPPEVKRFMQATLSMQRISTPLVSPILEKVNENHISKILEIAEKEDERLFADTQSARKYTLINTILILGFFGFLTVFLVNKDIAVYQEILKIIIIFGGGLGSGFGLKGYLDRKNK
ncbi:MAG: hypothetical protein EAZ09_16095 [Oscillatoriales cyanobacterium]|nr:MAG: hypothetical protein EAZ18_13385 [Oscillatoriales cyanobacterium]TAH19462.1 MAG: hypothetical protein EAZ09_16095 [Oscillatoriales cyanobacterium]